MMRGDKTITLKGIVERKRSDSSPTVATLLRGIRALAESLLSITHLTRKASGRSR